MTIAAEYTIEPVAAAQRALQFVDAETGYLTEVGMGFLNELREFLSGVCRNIACNASGSNVITLTPVSSSPPIRGYFSFDIFIFAAAAGSTGAVTMTVVPAVGTLPTLPAYIDDGATQADSGDVVANSVYMAIFADHLNGGAGGFVLK